MAETARLTYDGKEVVNDLLIDKLEEIGVGTDDSSPSRNDSELGEEVYRDLIDGTSDVDVGTTQYDLRLGTVDANDEDLTELGIYTDDGRLLNRIVYADIHKTDDFEIQFEVDVEVSNA